ncbi:Gfo/Idh/MocA family protein [Kineococcus aurantiacus]|uniref:Inositol 2-dehydrogenase n=1 Tax=Kineococcus aurantiacus TaxID=37633 RepID=A0A7Y9DMN3_9ACTN|nr:Gfo/Idh/MocA family oxidoreductase [Kineococcus aurantiacus]NYD23339.1 myo-inositol 2-dehydrogenase/D-chiro-inositol 1-dehydrogenase [Kineococcus aurantiacus]
MSTSSTPTTTLDPDSARQGYDRDRLVRVAVLGVGMMGQDHARRLATLTAGAELVAVSDVDVARTDAVAQEFGVRAIHDPRAAVTDPEVDALVIATPGFTHEDLVLLALDAGKPVLCEKPLTTSPETSRRIVEREAELGRQLVQVGFMRRFDAGYQQLRALIASGDHGAPLFLHCAHRNATTPPNFNSEQLMLDSVVHEVDVTRYLTGEEVVAIRVIAPRSTAQAPEGLRDPQFVIMETESGILVDVEIFVNTTFGYEVRTELVAERGQARIGLPEGMVTQSAQGWGGSIPKDFKERFGAAYDTEFQRWIDAVRNGTNVDGPGVWDGYAAAAVCAAGVRSLRTGERVEVDLGPRP